MLILYGISSTILSNNLQEQHIYHPALALGGTHIDMIYVYVPAFWGTFSRILV